MTTRTCRECTTAFAVGLPACPHCESTDHEETGMPKITVHNGPSNADVEKECPGNPSSPSTEVPQTASEESKTLPQKPARTTELPSSRDKKATSTARSTASTTGRATASGKGRTPKGKE